MPSQRLTEVDILGYRIDRIDAPDSPAWEVLAPENAAVLARFADRESAERFIILRELRAIELRPRNAAY